MKVNQLRADLTQTRHAKGLVIFAHGSGSSRLSPRNRLVAQTLNAGRFSTLLADLLTPEEERIDERDGSLRFNIPLLAERTVQLIDWARSDPSLERMPIGLFGASTGAAAAIIAAQQRPDLVQAVVSRGGRIDLAGSALHDLRAPLLAVVGENDWVVRDLHERALGVVSTDHEYVVVPGATHLFEEPGALEKAADLANDWFARYLGN